MNDKIDEAVKLLNYFQKLLEVKDFNKRIFSP